MNPKPTLIVITSYPEKGVVHSAHTVGVASYSKNLLQSIKTQYPQLQIIVLAERLAACQQCEYLDNGIIVRRCWRRNHPASLQKILYIDYSAAENEVFYLTVTVTDVNGTRNTKIGRAHV